jgi:hypothetical protein
MHHMMLEFLPTRASAMELKIVGNQIILSGPVVGDEPEKRMILPRAILFDLDDTILVAFGPAQSQWQRTIAAFCRPARADRGDGHCGGDRGGLDRTMGRSGAAQILAPPYRCRAPPRRRDRPCSALGGRPSGAARGDR